MDQATMAAIADGPVPDDGEDSFGLTSPAEKETLYRALATLCRAGIPLDAAVARMLDVLAEPVGDQREAARVARYARRLGTSLAKPPKSGREPMLRERLEDAGFLLGDVERCMFSFTVDEAGVAGVAAAFCMALEYATGLRAQAAATARARRAAN